MDTTIVFAADALPRGTTPRWSCQREDQLLPSLDRQLEAEVHPGGASGPRRAKR